MQIFNSENSGRFIYIKVDEEFITFYWDSEVRYFNERKEYLHDNEIQDELENDEPNNFYWIPIKEWINNNEHWVNHMKEKNWFTDRMLKYINKETKI